MLAAHAIPRKLAHMSDISFNISWFELLIIFGWPGFFVGAVLGALVWRKRRIVGAGLGALTGLLLWAAIALAIKLG